MRIPIIAGVTVIFVGVMLGILMNQKNAQRGIASVDPQEAKIESSILKSRAIESIRWEVAETKSLLTLSLPGGLGCKDFIQGFVFLRPEGLSEDGEVTSFQIEANCVKDQFTVEVDHRLAELMKLSKNQPDFFEKPQELYVSRIQLLGPAGEMNISSYELQSLKGEQLRLKIQE